jgi:hypothetical protein
MNVLENLFGAGLIPKIDFPPESRYQGSTLRAYTAPDGRSIAYLARRLVPAPESFATISVHRVAQGERIDRLAAALTGNAQQFWMLCDSNGAVWPTDLEVPETSVRVTMPAGLDVSGADS